MPRYRALADDSKYAAAFRENVSEQPCAVGRTAFPVRFVGPDDGVPDGFVVVCQFDAIDTRDAARVFRGIASRGVAPRASQVINEGADDGTPAARYWRFNGDSRPINDVLADFGLAGKIPLKRLNAHPGFQRVTNFLNNVQERYHASRKENGIAVMLPRDLAMVADTLARADEEVTDLAVVVASAGRSIDAARRAFGIATDRPFTLPGPALATEPDDEPLPPKPKGPQPRPTAGAK